MKNIRKFEEFVNESVEATTMKSAVLDFVEKKGNATWKEIHTFIMKKKGLDPNDKENRGYFSSYFSGGSYFSSMMNKKDTKTGRNTNTHGLLMIPTLKDPRYLEKQADGTYIVKVWDKKSKLN
jgi:hypothetical protein